MFFRKKNKDVDEVPAPPSLDPNTSIDLSDKTNEIQETQELDLPPMPDDLNDIEEFKPKVSKKKATKNKSSKKKSKKVSTTKTKVKKEEAPILQDETDLMLEKSFNDPTIKVEEDISIEQLDRDLKDIEKSISMTESALKKIDSDLLKINKKMK